MKRLLWMAPISLMILTALWVGSQGCHEVSGPVFPPTPTGTPTATATCPPTLFNGCETLTDNGTWNPVGIVYTTALSLSTLNVTQGTHSLDVDITTAAGFNQNMLILTGFTPNVWSNVYQLEMDVTVDPSVVAGAGYHTLLFVVDSSSAGKYFTFITNDTNTLNAGFQTLSWKINFSAGTMPPSAQLSKITFIYNNNATGGTGNIYVDNIRLVTCP